MHEEASLAAGDEPVDDEVCDRVDVSVRIEHDDVVEALGLNQGLLADNATEVRLRGGDGTVTDLVTGRMRTQTADLNGDGTITSADERTLGAALASASSLRTGGHSDDALDVNSDAVAYVTLQYAMSTQDINGIRGKGNFRPITPVAPGGSSAALQGGLHDHEHDPESA